MSPELKIILAWMFGRKNWTMFPPNVKKAAIALKKAYCENVDNDDFFYSDTLRVGDFKVTPTLYDNLLKCYAENQKIMAIKLLRQWFNCGLREAKDAMDSFWDMQKFTE
ncbi:MAG: hypothetical protein ACXACY_28700 [Candidatus Hodarchaeales archaeon]|jgi:hypothetical protein